MFFVCNAFTRTQALDGLHRRVHMKGLGPRIENNALYLVSGDLGGHKTVLKVKFLLPFEGPDFRIFLHLELFFSRRIFFGEKAH